MLSLGDFAHHEWSSVPVTKHPGVIGTAFEQELVAGPFRIRKVRYGAEYHTDHWCQRGHIVLVVAGTLEIELRDARTIRAAAGDVFWISEQKYPHRVCSAGGAEIYVIDEQ